MGVVPEQRFDFPLHRAARARLQAGQDIVHLFVQFRSQLIPAVRLRVIAPLR